MRIALLVLPALLLISSAGCRKTVKPDIPIYPGAQAILGAGTIKDPSTVLFNSKWHTPASAAQVRIFYEQALLSRPGWKLTGDLREQFVFTDGNLRRTDTDLYVPIDPARGAGLVEVLIGEPSTVIDIWQSFPAPK